MSQRIKGLECSLALTTPDGTKEDIFEDVLEAEITISMEILSKMYLGQVGEKYDDIFKGIKGNVKFHMETTTYLAFTEVVQDRATRRTAADGVFNLSFTMNFPNGQKARLTCENCFFGDLPIKVGGQSEYIEGGIDFACSTLRRIL
jgi:hypothetical protein